MVNLLLAPEKDLAKSGIVKTIFDPGAFVKIGSKQASVTTRIPGENRSEALYWIDPAKLGV